MQSLKPSKKNDLSNTEPRWFAFYVMPHCEIKVANKLVNKGLEVFLPIKKELHFWSDRKKEVNVLLFTSYVFAKIKREDFYCHIKFINQIVKIVDIGGEIFSISDNEIEWLRKISTSGYQVSSDQIKDYKSGDKAKVKRGVLLGMEGIILDHSGKNKFAFEIPLLKRILVIEIDGEFLERI